MVQRRDAGTFVAAVLGAVLLVGGCGGEAHEPKPLDQSEETKTSEKSEEPTPTPTPTATDTGPKEVPSIEGGVESEKRQQAGEKFLRSYIDEVNRSGRTGDFSKLKSMIADTCGDHCDAALAAEDLYQKGGSIEGGEWTATNVDYQGTIGDGMTFEVSLKIGAGDKLDQNGNAVEHYDAGTSTHLYAVSDKSGEWQVVGGEDVSNEQ